MTFQPDLAFAQELDARDPLASYRERFHLPTRGGESLLYLCGHSLGLMPRAAETLLAEELERWRRLAVEAHFTGPRAWVSFHEELAELGATLVGARQGEVVHMNGLTVNLHLLMVSFYRPTAARHKIVIEEPAFPSDRYAVESQIRFHGFDPADALVTLAPRPGAAAIEPDDVAALLETQGESIALVLLPGLQYYSGQAFDLAAIAELGHARGCVVGSDLAHAAGNLELRLHDWDLDFAVWCGYKYLNGGPGAPAGCFVHERHARAFELPRFAGWWGHDKASRFEMGPTFRPLSGAEGWQLSNPPVLAMAPLLASLQIFAEAGMSALRAKALQLSDYLRYLVELRLANRVRILTPAAPAAHGCQLSFQFPGRGRGVHAALEARGVVCDWREPDVLRVAPVPLYNQFAEVHRFATLLGEELERQ